MALVAFPVLLLTSPSTSSSCFSLLNSLLSHPLLCANILNLDSSADFQVKCPNLHPIQYLTQECELERMLREKLALEAQQVTYVEGMAVMSCVIFLLVGKGRKGSAGCNTDGYLFPRTTITAKGDRKQIDETEHRNS